MVYYSALHWAKKAEKSVEECQNIKNSLGVIYEFKGSVQTNKDLPTNAKIGDVYDVKDTGINYAWTGTEWDALGVTVDFDLSEYATKEYVNTTEQEIIENYMEADTALQTQITSLSTVVDEEQEKIIGIESKIPTSASSSNLLVTNTDMFNATQDVRSDFAEADSELQTQINGQATAIASKQDKLTAGTGIKIENNVVSNTQTSAEWGKITGDITSQSDLKAAFDDKIGKTGDEEKNGSLGIVGTLGVTADTEDVIRDSWRLSTNQPGVYKMGYRFVGGKGIFFSDYNFKYDSDTLDSETIISNTNMGGTFGSSIKLTSSTSGGYGEVSLNADQAKAPNPETKSIENIATTPWVEGKLTNATPTGTVISFAGSTAPSGYLICDGAAISRTTYANLFNVISTKYGTGDGSTTFNLPNLTDKFIQGSKTVGTVKSAGLPNITGSTSNWYLKGDKQTISDSGAITTTNGTSSYVQTGSQSGTIFKGLSFNASRSNTIYGKSSTVQPPALTMLYCIKY